MRLCACWASGAEPGRVWELVERSDGFLVAGDAARYFGPAGDWAERTLPFAQHVRGRVLDIGAGAGRVALALQAAGLEVVALDTSPGAVEVCRVRGVEQVYCGTVSELAAAGAESFDTFILAGNNLGLLGGRDQRRSFLLRSGLSPLPAQLSSVRSPILIRPAMLLTWNTTRRTDGSVGLAVKSD